MIKKFQLLVLLAASLAASVSAVDRRTARVNVKNATRRTIFGVSVVHKYSNVYKNRHEWGIIPSGSLGNDSMTVEYNTGLFTTGRDWWMVSWFDAGFDKIHYTDPNNLRGLVDRLEDAAPDALAAAAGVVATLPASLTGPGAVAAGAAAAVIAKATTSQLFNSESTEGFKQHILRTEDAGLKTTIIIRRDGTVVFHSNSGDSSTVTSVKAVPIDKP